jgi:hypothetical protein
MVHNNFWDVGLVESASFANERGRSCWYRNDVCILPRCSYCVFPDWNLTYRIGIAALLSAYLPKFMLEAPS